MNSLFKLIKRKFKSFKRGVSGWGMFDNDNPKYIIAKVKIADTYTLIRLGRCNSSITKGSPADLQQKAIKRELKYRNNTTNLIYERSSKN